jgi:fatty-acyl-CoA synthase
VAAEWAGYLAAIFACARLGALAIHINTRFRISEVGSLLRRSGAVALVTEWGFAPVDFPAIFSALPAEDRAALGCVLGLQLPPGTTQLAGLPVLSLDGAAADAGPDEATGETPCLTFTTSGTTGGPKLVLHDQQTIAGHAADVARHIGLDAPDAVLLGTLPFCGSFGNVTAMAAVAAGARIVCLAQSRADHVPANATSAMCSGSRISPRTLPIAQLAMRSGSLRLVRRLHGYYGGV